MITKRNREIFIFQADPKDSSVPLVSAAAIYPADDSVSKLG